MVPFEQALHFFFSDAQVAGIEPLGEGKINDTWLVTLAPDSRVVLQRVPKAVFPRVDLVMENIRHVLKGLTKYQRQTNTPRELLELLTSSGGEQLYLDEHGDGWRCFSYIHSSRTQEQLTSTEQAEGIGAMLGLFHAAVHKLPADDFHEPLPDFHNTAVYLKKLEQALAGTTFSCDLSRQCTTFVTRLQPQIDQFLAAQPTLSHQVIHGDPKVSNFLFAENSNQVISIIDLDTVQSGLLLHDLGDCLRSCCNQSGEEYTKHEDITFSADYFQAALQGYRKNAPDLLTSSDLNYLPDAVGAICFELGVRFFSDHLNGDIYFKTTRQGQNLDRALIQFSLAESVYGQQQNLHNIVAQVFR